MSYFTSEFVEFFEELAANNHKEWFDLNRKRYEATVKRPFQEFVQEMIDRIRADDPTVDILPKDAIMRINRDIRFANDKTPYHTYVAAIISPGGKKDKTTPGSYLNLNAEKITFYGGAYCLEKDQLNRLRTRIMKDPETLSNLVNAAEFKAKFGAIQGEKNKRLPPEFREAAEREPLLYNKQLCFGSELSKGHITSPDLADTLMGYYHAGKPLNQFLRDSMA
jgi:uncharacterized protein (TIGR02453 family)